MPPAAAPPGKQAPKAPAPKPGAKAPAPKPGAKAPPLQNAYAHWEKTAETYLKRTQGDFEEIGEPPSDSDAD